MSVRWQRPSRRASLTWLAYGTTGLGLLLLALTILESYTVHRSFRATDLMVEQSTTATLREHLALCAEQLAAHLLAESSGVVAAVEDDDKIIKSATDLKLPQKAIVELFKERQRTGEASLSGLAAHLRRDAAQNRQAETSQSAERAVWQGRSYWLFLMTNNLVLLWFGAVFFLVTLYVSMESGARLGEARARRAVMDAERNRASFLAAAGHDLRQPIQAMELFLSTLQQRSLDSRTRAILRNIEDATASMKRMIGGLLDIAKLDASTVSTDIVDIELDGLLSSVRGEFEQLAAVKSLTFSVPATMAVVQTDPVLLESILRNLLSNAIRYTNKGGVGIQAAQTGQTVTVTVYDTGTGIPEDKREAIFQDFYRLHSSATEGLGLGLGIVRRLCKLLHCEVCLVSTVGQGSKFSVTLPAGRNLILPESVPATQAVGDRRVTALLLEDNDTVRDALVGQLNCWNFDVIQVDNGAQARTKIKGSSINDFDIVIADYHLPDDNGLGILQDLRADLGARPCLLITGATAQVDLDRIRSSGLPWLPKPLNLLKFRDEVRRLAVQAGENRRLASLSQEL
jgi:signal transduction histidine kinase/CheY-like chemotaxis protein